MTQADYPAIQSVDPSIGKAELQPAWQYEHLDLNNDPNQTRGNGLWDAGRPQGDRHGRSTRTDMIACLFPGQSIQPACSPAPPGLWYATARDLPGL